MVIDIVQKAVKMSFSVVDLAKSSRETNSKQNDAIVYNYDQSISSENTKKENTPVKMSTLIPSMTSTPLSQQNKGDQLKRKREIDSIYSEESSFDSSDSLNSDNVVVDDDQPRKKARCIFTNFQVSVLEKRHTYNKYLPIEERPVLAQQLDLSQLQVKTWFQNRRMKEKRQHKNKNQKMFYHHHGAVDISVAMGMPYSPVPVSGCQPTDLPGYTSHHQYTGSPSMQMFDPMLYMYGMVSPITFPGYQSQFYNGLSPQPSKHYRV